MVKHISKIAHGSDVYYVKDVEARNALIDKTEKGVANGVATLDSSGKVPSSLLPSYVDDIIEGYYHEDNFYATFTPGENEDPDTYSDLITPETGKIYVNKDTNYTYRWSGSAYVMVGSPTNLELTSATIIAALGYTPSATDTTYTAGTGLALTGTEFALATSGVTAGSYGPSADVDGTDGTTISVPYITVDEYGRVTSISNKTYTSRNTDTDTTYSAGTKALLDAGTDTSNRVWPASVIADYVTDLGYITSSGNAANVTGTVAIANGGTGATTRLNALKALTNENVSSAAKYFLTITNSWGKGGYTSVADAKTVLAMTGATASAAGTAGVVPAPAKGKQTSFLRGDGTWVVPTDTTYSASTGLSLSGTAFSVKYGTAAGTACQGNDSRLSDSRKASDVYSWAKASSKPSYAWSEITGKPTIATIVTGTATIVKTATHGYYYAKVPMTNADAKKLTGMTFLTASNSLSGGWVASLTVDGTTFSNCWYSSGGTTNPGTIYYAYATS